ncbi:hypothetical protein EYF80_021579 [Liparis tanakae]|uniref:Uncharacterized protein n=1 Tax=Liparis tanakae TaxID=230148 RepID=A0A4Z2HRB9_9TELE|nr:hypothetical protein EYF80_021579 [Liparis tanakae]
MNERAHLGQLVEFDSLLEQALVLGLQSHFTNDDFGVPGELIYDSRLEGGGEEIRQQPQLVQDQRHVHGVTPKPLHAKQESHGRLELSRQEQHLEIQEGLLARGEMGLSCWKPDERERERGREREMVQKC